jgi:tRNA A-37 threonylcarbamoyl transferase component Bud32
MTDLNVPNDRDEASPEPPETPGTPNDPTAPVEPSRPANASAGNGASASGDGRSGSKTPPPRVPPSRAGGEPGETSIDPPPTAMPGESAGDEGTSSEGDWWVRSGGGPSWGRQRGQRIAGYELVDRIDKDANNAFGEVWLARRLDPFQRVAIKFLRPDRVKEELVRRFAQAESKALARFNHPYIARFYELGRDGDTPYLVMQYVPGDQVTRYCDARGLSIERRLELMAKLCDAVQHVHLQGLVHRDLKPGNILVSETGPGERSADDAEADGGPIPVLIDFGLAKSTNPDNPLTSGMPDGVGRGLFGTYSYASPEQIRATRDEDTGREADIYALGAVLFELLVGVSPMQHVLED